MERLHKTERNSFYCILMTSVAEAEPEHFSRSEFFVKFEFYLCFIPEGVVKSTSHFKKME